MPDTSLARRIISPLFVLLPPFHPMSEQPRISIEELEKAIAAVQRGQEPQVDLPPEVVQAIMAAMSQLGNFTPTPEFLQKLQQSLESRLVRENPTVTISIPLKYLRRFGYVIASVVFVGGVWGFFGDSLSLQGSTSLPQSVERESSDPIGIAQADRFTNTPPPKPSEVTESVAAPIATADNPIPTLAPETDVQAAEVEKTPASVYSYLIKISPKEYAKIRDTVFPLRVTEYLPEEYWLELKPTEAAKLSKSIRFTPVKDPFQLFQREGYDDPLAGLPTVSSDLEASIVPGSPTLFLLQFVGESKPEWSQTLEDQGVVVVGSDNDYRRILVWATPEDADKLAGQDFVRWIGPLHPQYKVQEKLLSTKVPAFAVKMILYVEDAAMLEQSKVAIFDLKGVISSKDEAIADDHRVTLDVMITPDIVDDLAKIPNVISIYAEKSREYQ